MKHLLLPICSFLFFINTVFAQSDPKGPIASLYVSNASAKNSTERIPSFSDLELATHIKQLSSNVMTLRFNPVVKSYIKTYTVKQREKTATMISRMAMYFSMFEKYAREENVPTDLKYLAMVESALDPHAESRSGAVGLWQFMPRTATSVGLKINKHIDERKDPHKATRAAFRYLKKQYNRYGNWELALAAYNGGAGRVNRAIKRGRSKNFWRIKKYLPRETRAYIPAFIGATYISHYYALYNIVPTPVLPELANTAMTTIKGPLTFQQISEITGTPFYIISLLNPSYIKALIPYSHSGNHLVLPQGDMVRFLQHIGKPDHKLEQLVASRVDAPRHNDDENMMLITHDVGPGETIEEVAAMYNHSVEKIIQWNKLKDTYLRPGQRLMLFVHKTPTRLLKYQTVNDLSSSNTERFSYHNFRYKVLTGFIPQVENPGKFASIRPDDDKDYVFYRLRKRETLMDVVEKFPHLSLEQLMLLNDLDRFSKIPPGMKLKIKKR